MSAPADKRWIAKLRAEGIQPFVRATDTVLEYGADDDLNLVELTAGRKVSVPVNADLTAFRDVDVVLCYHVLEYLEEPRELVFRFKEVLKPGGTLLVFALYDNAFRRPNRREQAKHFYSWNVQTLGNLLVDCGYEFLSGEIKRCPNEEAFLRWAAKVGYTLAQFGYRVFTPEFKVRVAGKCR
jgi:SAM-dependent methyltransferase